MSSIPWVLAGCTLLCFSRRAEAASEPVVAIDVEPRITYRTFRDREPTSADKNYATSAILGGALRVQLFPLVRVPRALAQLGVYAQGAAGLVDSKDVDVPPDEPGHDVATNFWRVGTGLMYRVRLEVIPLAITLLAGAERWSFSFDMPSPPQQLTPTARYSFARAGADASARLGRMGLSAEASFLLPWSIDDLGDRPVLSKGWGVQGAMGASWALAPSFALLADVRYALFRFSLPQILPRTTASATVLDRYLDLSVGGRLSW